MSVKLKKLPIVIIFVFLIQIDLIFLSGTQAKDSSTLRILNLNVWGLPGVIGTDVKARMKIIANSLNPYDIVLLQETFDVETEALPKLSGFPYTYHHQNAGALKINSGLMILSKYPIVKTVFKAFKHCIITDCLARKGVLLARLKHPTLGFVDTYNTHYQSWGRYKEAVHVRQTYDHQALIDLITFHSKGYPTIIAGDFNMKAELEEYQNLMGRLPLIDSYKLANPNKKGFTFASFRHLKRIDYIFILKNSLFNINILDSHISHNKPVNGYYPSDHMGIDTTVKFISRF